MEVKNLHDLEKIIALCRKKGVENIEINGIKLKLTDEEPKSRYLQKKEKAPQEGLEIKQQYTDMDILAWSSTQNIGSEGI